MKRENELTINKVGSDQIIIDVMINGIFKDEIPKIIRLNDLTIKILDPNRVLRRHETNSAMKKRVLNA